MMSYARLLAHYPYVVLGILSVFAMTCTVVVFTVGPPLDFSDARLGFEARGTELSGRIRALNELLENTQSDFTLASGSRVLTSLTVAQQPQLPQNTTVHYVPNADNQRQPKPPESMNQVLNSSYTQKSSFFCDQPRKDYARIVFSSEDQQTLFTAKRIHEMCTLEDEKIRSHPEFRDICIQETVSGECCHSWSLGNYIALLVDKSSCYAVNESDVREVFEILKFCEPKFHDHSLSQDCWGGEDNDDTGLCPDVPSDCKKYNAVFNILHFLSDVDFMEKGSRDLNVKLTYAVVMLPIANSLATKQLYKKVESEELVGDEVKVVGIYFGLKEELFEFYLKKDMVWIILSVLVVILVMWIYTASLFITLMAILCIMMSLTISFFLYTMVYEIKFFPFMNLLAIVILVGIGCDDVFIYVRVWTMTKFEKNVGTLEKVISDTLKHAALSMFVTSLTTAGAFFANYSSDITALKCFGLYTGTTIMVNFILMATWIPASMVIHDKWCAECCFCYSPSNYTPQNGVKYHVCKIPLRLYKLMCDWGRIFFEKILPWIVIKLRILWIIVFGGLGMCSLVIVLYYPQLKLPVSNEFQVFAQDHPFEVYDFKLKDKFWFEKSSLSGMTTMPLTVVFGLNPVDNGDHLDPFSVGTLEFDKSFLASTPEAQQWLLGFCTNLRSSEFYQSETPELTNCFIDAFQEFMKRKCKGFNGENLSPCCEETSFPYPADTFNQCLKVWTPLLVQSRYLYHANPFAGPRYNRGTGKIDAIVIEFNSKVPFSFSYEKMKLFYQSMNQKVNAELLKAPNEMRNGWFISHLDFYDLQRTLAHGTPVAIGISLAIASVVAFFTTLNVLVTIYAMVSISISIFATIAVLVMLGWQLNILESVTISVAVGMSIDFTLHYGMAYRLSPDLDRTMRVSCGTSRMGGPIAMAAFTTFMAGALMMPATILAYRQLGTFLMLVMSISWLYSTLFYQSLLQTIGPEGGFGQFHWPSWDCCDFGGDQDHVDKTVYTMSDSTVSNSTTHVNSSETHELEPLTDRESYQYGRSRSCSASRTPSKQTSNGSLSSFRHSHDTVRQSSNSSIHTDSRQSLRQSFSIIEDKISVEAEEEEEETEVHSQLLKGEEHTMDKSLSNNHSIESIPKSVDTNIVHQMNGNDIWIKRPPVEGTLMVS